jgi:hypothetical protein
MKLRSLAALAFAIGLLPTGCANGGTASDTPADPTGSATPSDEATVSPSASGSHTPTASPTAGASPLIEDGRNFAFVKSLDLSADPDTVTYDLAYMLTGEAANQAAKKHGDEVPPPNDYYIVNDNPKLRTVPLSPDVRLVFIEWSHCCDETFEASLEAFARALDEGEMTIDGHVYKGRLSPYWLLARDGEVVRIEEQYLP